MKYTNDEKQWLLTNGGTMPYKDLTNLFNKTFPNSQRDYQAIRKYCQHRLKIVVGTNAFTKIKHIDYLLKLYKDNIDKPIYEIGKMYNEHFGTNYSEDSLEKVVWANGLHKTELGHRKGNTHNESPFGSIIVNTNGYEMIKVKQGTKDKNWHNGYITKAQYVWQQYHPNETINDNEFIVFVNKDLRDYRKENLVKITKSEWVEINHQKMSGMGECLLATIDIIRTKKAIREMR